MKLTDQQLAELKAPKDAATPGAASIEFDNWYDSKFKPAMERGPFDKYVARQAWFAAREAIPALLADLEDVQRELENERARGIHTCHDNCTRDGCVNRRLREELNTTHKQLEEATAARGNGVLVPAPRLEEMQAEIRALRKQLAEAQALLFNISEDVPCKCEEHSEQADELLDRTGHKALDSILAAAIADAIEPYYKDAERWKELLSRLGDDSGPTIVKIAGWSDEYPGYAWFADLTQEQVIAELDAAIAAKGVANE